MPLGGDGSETSAGCWGGHCTKAEREAPHRAYKQEQEAGDSSTSCDPGTPCWSNSIRLSYEYGVNCAGMSTGVCMTMSMNKQELWAKLKFQNALDRLADPCHGSDSCQLKGDAKALWEATGIPGCANLSWADCASLIPIGKLAKGGEFIVDGIRLVRASDGTVRLAEGIDHLVASGVAPLNENGIISRAGQSYEKHMQEKRVARLPWVNGGPKSAQ
jgi:hypothetical protein